MPQHGYHSPVTVILGDETASLIVSEPEALTVDNAPAVDGAPQASVSRVQKRRPTIILTMSEQLSLSDPTPPHSATNSMSDSEDKKRNKLGYQRISIACAHCRRRKIRCLLAEGDAQDRCQNCIRLKKECVFYPVDQQQILDNRSQSGAKPGPGSIPSSAVSPSPPELASGRPFERNRQYGSFPSLPSLPSNAPPGFAVPISQGGGFHGQSDLMPGHPGHGLPTHDPVGLPPTDYGYQQAPSDGQRQWEQVGDMHSPSATMNRARDSMQSQYYRSSPTVPSTADFAPFPNGASSAPPMQHPDGPFQYSMPQAQAWNQPQAARTMAYTHPQEMGAQGYMPPGVSYPAHSAHEGQPTIPATYGSSGATPAPNLASHPLPLGSPMVSFGQPHPYMFQPQGSVSASPIPSQQPYGNQWYGQPSHYGSSEQELRSSSSNRPFTSRPGR